MKSEGRRVMLDFDLAEMYEIETKIPQANSKKKYRIDFQPISCSSLSKRGS